VQVEIGTASLVVAEPDPLIVSSEHGHPVAAAQNGAIASGSAQSNTTAATGPIPANAEAGSLPTVPRWLTTQNSLPSGSAITTHDTSSG